MSLRNSSTAYGSVAKILHWVMFLIITVLLIIGFFADDLSPVDRSTAMFIHKSLGLITLWLVMCRLLWVWVNPRPALPRTVHRLERVVSHIVQGLLYVGMIVMTTSGWIFATAANKPPTLFGLFSFPAPGVPQSRAVVDFFLTIHGVAAWVLIGLIVFHVAGALKHHLFDKDNVLRNMLPNRSQRS